MKIHTTKKGDIIIIALEGNLMGGEEADEYYELLQTQLDAGYKKIILNLQKTRFINSSGIGMFIRSYGICEKSGAEIKIAEFSDEVENTLFHTKLYTVIKHHKKLEDAIEDFNG
jgi:anti-sigma B factor antagonist